MHSVVPPLIMGTIQIILLNQIRLRAWTKIQLVFWGILNFFWALVAGGFSETYALFQAAALFFSLVVILVAEKFKFTNTALFLASGFLGAVSALIIVILAPGNLERQSFFPPAPGVIGILTISLKGFLVYTIGLANSAGKIMAILGLFGLAAIAGARLPREMNSRLLIVIPGLTVGFTFLCFPPAAYGLSDAPPGRTLILPTYFFLIGLLALGTVCGNLLTKKQNFIVSKMLPSLVMVTVILAASIHSINLYRSRSEFIEFAARWDEMDAQIVKSKQNGAAEIFIPVIQNWASINTPNDNPKFWVNICMSSYYGVQVFATPDPSAPAP